MARHIYQPPVSKLLTYGDAYDFNDWPDYLSLGLTAEHLPELLLMVFDSDLATSESDSLLAWAPIHAMRAVSQLHEPATIEPLIPLLDRAEDDTMIFEEAPEVFAGFGPGAIPVLSSYLSDTAHQPYSRVAAADGLTRIASKYPEQRQQIVEMLADELLRPEQDDLSVNGFLVSDLLDLKAVEAATAIKAAFYARKVDVMIAGDWYNVREELDIDASVEVPGPDPEHEDFVFPDFLPEMLNFPDHRNPQVRSKLPKNVKSKRKQEKKSRKQNRKKK